MVLTQRQTCRDDEVPMELGILLILLLYVCITGLVIVISIIRSLISMKGSIIPKRKRGSTKVHNNKEVLPRKKATEAASTGMAIKRLLFHKQYGGVIEDEDGYVEANTGSRRDSSKNPWETDVKKIKFKSKIGAGNFGEVWVGQWMNSTVAIKTVLKSMANNSDFVNKFIEEIQLMSELNHPNIVMFLGACIQPPQICLILEYCVHGNLITFLQTASDQDINISMHLILKMALDIARGIKYLHEKMQIIQRDIKGRNVLVDENLNAKIADFGLSRLKKEEDIGLTACGTPAWTAPEVVRMEDYTEKVDVYSFAVVLWELVMRDEPYDGEGGIQIAYAAAEQGLRPAIPDFIPPRYAQLMSECWADSPDDRPHFAEILERLFQMMKDESNPFKSAEFYFGAKPQNSVTHEIEQLLDDSDLSQGLFMEDYMEIKDKDKPKKDRSMKNKRPTLFGSGKRFLEESNSSGKTSSRITTPKESLRETSKRTDSTKKND